MGGRLQELFSLLEAPESAICGPPSPPWSHRQEHNPGTLTSQPRPSEYTLGLRPTPAPLVPETDHGCTCSNYSSRPQCGLPQGLPASWAGSNHSLSQPAKATLTRLAPGTPHSPCLLQLRPTCQCGPSVPCPALSPCGPCRPVKDTWLQLACQRHPAHRMCSLPRGSSYTRPLFQDLERLKQRQPK